MDTKHALFRQNGMCIYLPNLAGGFDLAGCPDAENLAAFIVKAVNAHKQLKACLELCVERIVAECADPDHLQEVILARAALADLEGK